jgi:uncharacterized protein (DUF433 family)
MDDLLVSRDPEVMSGALCFRSTRVPVKNLFDYLEGSSTLEDFLEDFPSISRATAVSVLEAARERLALDATAGYMTASDHVAVMKRVDSQGNVIGFTIENVSSFRKGNPLEASLVPAA